MGRFGWFFFSSRRRHTRWTGDWSSDVCSSDLDRRAARRHERGGRTCAPRRSGQAEHLSGGDDARRRQACGGARETIEIGRASCRERVEISEVAVAGKKKKKNRTSRWRERSKTE